MEQITEKVVEMTLEGDKKAETPVAMATPLVGQTGDQDDSDSDSEVAVDIDEYPMDEEMDPVSLLHLCNFHCIARTTFQ